MLGSVCAGVLSKHISLLGMRGVPPIGIAGAGRDANANGKAEAGCGKIRGEPELTPGGGPSKLRVNKPRPYRASGDC
jgi:hypothetical protein